MMEHKLVKGQGVVLFGKDGSGKTTTAKKMANNHGKYVTLQMKELFDYFSFSFLDESIKTVIVDGFNGTPDEISKAKQLVTEDEIMVERKGKNPRFEKLPNFIFCSGAVNPIPVGKDERRFVVFEI